MKDDNYWEDIETCLIKNYVVKIQFKKCFTDDVITVHIMGYDMKRSFNYINISYINQIWIFNINQLPLLYYISVKIFGVLPSSYWGLLSIPLPTLSILIHDRIFCSSLIVSLCPLMFPSKLFFLAY